MAAGPASSGSDIGAQLIDTEVPSGFFERQIFYAR
jgi:hypothetical protein